MLHGFGENMLVLSLSASSFMHEVCQTLNVCADLMSGVGLPSGHAPGEVTYAETIVVIHLEYFGTKVR